MYDVTTIADVCGHRRVGGNTVVRRGRIGTEVDNGPWRISSGNTPDHLITQQLRGVGVDQPRNQLSALVRSKNRRCRLHAPGTLCKCDKVLIEPLLC